MQSRHLAAVLILVLTAGPVHAAGCRVDPFSAPFGSDVETHMVVRSGQLCGVKMQMGLQNRSANVGGSTGMTISEPAGHGSASVPTPQSWAYVSQPGYVGKDRFVVESSGEVMSRYVIRGTSHYAVNVDVVP